jgi:L-asparaginase II
MAFENYVPVVEVTRGPIVESVHFGAAIVVDSTGSVVASIGDPQTTSFLRSSAKPFQALPFVERGGVEKFGLSDRELALMCSSHHGTDEHVEVVTGMQAKIGLQESDLMCGAHVPADSPTWKAMILRGESPAPRRHNCSGKHTGMLAHAVMRGFTKADYINPHHPVQKTILETFSEMTALEPGQVVQGIDGCSVPTFAIPLYNAAFGFARLADPCALPEKRREALAHIFKAMSSNPVMIAGPGAFDTLVMEAGGGTVVSKGGAEGYQCLAVAPGVLAPKSPGLGIALKISDGDLESRARTLVALTILKQLGVISAAQAEHVAKYDRRAMFNFRKLEIGEIRPAFSIKG